MQNHTLTTGYRNIGSYNKPLQTSQILTCQICQKGNLSKNALMSGILNYDLTKLSKERKYGVMLNLSHQYLRTM